MICQAQVFSRSANLLAFNKWQCVLMLLSNDLVPIAFTARWTAPSGKPAARTVDLGATAMLKKTQISSTCCSTRWSKSTSESTLLSYDKISQHQDCYSHIALGPVKPSPHPLVGGCLGVALTRQRLIRATPAL
ncbi:hypothetical protein COCSUDRAFT_34551 [Coccomyxa subellipsoidea C-169]|uniref:Uncharacterized protein n=1 Tax=Coccomyxa subellipsoidea (strain C-169) TaxID=574566 RepID=I0YJ00_COCSC|nr:hypothetical protein COCSUDRAFT_34551 [Coccomyxa subellipsoidea C-169]EIE18369.1 hypothetical protein COCSUDRAFT_34551 [Coccomyxa subellipsoidea C-169]|eukprot:XP_005642913.1 hypothetical protein COCSUDRAFT_34551 [Coccomyxa subellipsoidea C-169]